MGVTIFRLLSNSDSMWGINFKWRLQSIITKACSIHFFETLITLVSKSRCPN